MIDTTACRDLMLRIAPELEAEPLYCLERPTGLPWPSGTFGYASRQNLLLQDVVEASGEWDGPGPFVVLDSDLDEKATLATTIHEASHLLPFTPSSPASTDRRLQAEVFEAWCSEPEPPSDIKPRWAIGNHDRNFHRICIHLWWRAAIFCNVVLPLDVICGGMRYDLSPATLYQRALDSEPLVMRDQSFADILANEPPKLFADVWYADLAYWLERHPSAHTDLQRENDDRRA